MKSKQTVSVLFMLTGIVFCSCLIVSNLLETKIIQLGPIAITGGVLCFPITYILNDCIAEVWGYRKARLIIWTAFAMNFMTVMLGLATVHLPSADYWRENEEHFNFVFSFAPRIAAASFIAFLTGSFINAYVMSRMKLSSGGHKFSLRAIVSTIWGESADSLIFFPIAFTGMMPVVEMLKLMALQVALKTGYEIIALPLTIRVVKFIKKHEGTDVYDKKLSYNPLKIGEL